MPTLVQRAPAPRGWPSPAPTDGVAAAPRAGAPKAHSQAVHGGAPACTCRDGRRPREELEARRRRRFEETLLAPDAGTEHDVVARRIGRVGLMGHHDRIDESPPLHRPLVVPDLDAHVTETLQRDIWLGQDLAQETFGAASAKGDDLPRRRDRVDEQPLRRPMTPADPSKTRPPLRSLRRSTTSTREGSAARSSLANGLP